MLLIHIIYLRMGGWIRDACVLGNVSVIGEMYKIQYIMHIIIIIKCFSIMNIIIMYQNIITVHFQVYMNDFHLQKKKLSSINPFILNVIVFLEIS